MITKVSDSIFPKIISGRADLDIPITGDSLGFTIELDERPSAFNVFLTIDDSKKLLPVYFPQVLSEPPEWVEVTKGVSFTSYLLYPNSIDPVNFTTSTKARLFLSFLNVGSADRVVHIIYFIYASRGK